MRTILVLLLLPLPAQAGTILLAEIQHTNVVLLNQPSQPILLEFVAEQADTMQVRLGGEYDSADVGLVFEAPPQDVALFEAALTQAAGGQWWINDTSHAPSPQFADSLWSDTVPRTAITRHVQRLGNGLFGYDLTDVTQTIDRLTYGVSSGTQPRPNVDHQHTIRLYGEPISVPEPAAWLLVLLGGTIHWRKR
ncbi:MAG TPA: hypothetical protein VGK58_19360 [Lacipirellulaceae bacterium]